MRSKTQWVSVTPKIILEYFLQKNFLSSKEIVKNIRTKFHLIKEVHNRRGPKCRGLQFENLLPWNIKLTKFNVSSLGLMQMS